MLFPHQNSSQPVLSVQGLSVQLSNQLLVDDINFSVGLGEIVSIIGPNGAGKTSCLKAIIGDMHQEREASVAGVVKLNDKPLNDMPIRKRACYVAMLPQSSELAFPFSVEEVISLGRSPHASGSVKDIDIVHDAAQLLDVKHLMRRSYIQLSGGEKQRVHLARVMAQVWYFKEYPSEAPCLLLLDEPMTGLDIGHQQHVMRAIRKFVSQGVAVVMSMHDINLAASYSDRILALNHGKKVAYGIPLDVLQVDTLFELYGVKVNIVKHPESGEPIVVADR